MTEFEAEIEQSKELSGILTLSSKAVPSLEEGSYTITARQQWNVGKLGATIRRFTVEAESVSMAPNQIYSVYPPNNSSGQYQDTLPHVILNRRTLPWERNPSPWLALLVFSADEQISLADGKYGELCKDAGVFVPALSGSAPDPETECRVIDIPADLFTDVLPVKEDLPYLAHVRDVSLDCKVTDQDVTNGGFACVISNRLPKPPGDGMPNVEHIAVLVSLDGFSDFLDKDAAARKAALGGKETVRMFVFTLWKFFCEGRDYNFAEVAKTLDIDVPCLRSADINKFDSPLKDILAKGYYPMNHCFREGSVGVSFYRPPLLPCCSVSENNEFGRYSDSLLKFDPELGMYDVSHSAAWQLGRLLSMQDQSLAKDILSWRISGKRNAAGNQNAAALKPVLEPFTEQSEKRVRGARRRRAESLEGNEWCGIVPDLKSTVGVMEAVDIEGSALSEETAGKLLSDDVGGVLKEVKESSGTNSNQLELLKSFNIL